MSELTPLERRVQKLEELVMHQQHLLEQLNEVIVKSRDEWELMQRRYTQQFLEIEAQLARGAAEIIEKPPHY